MINVSVNGVITSFPNTPKGNTDSVEFLETVFKKHTSQFIEYDKYAKGIVLKDKYDVSPQTGNEFKNWRKYHSQAEKIRSANSKAGLIPDVWGNIKNPPSKLSIIITHS